MDILSAYAKVLSPFLRSLPLGRRFDMALIAFHADLQFADSSYSDFGNNRIFSDAEVEEIFSGLDRESIDLAKKFMHRQYRCPPNGFMVHPKYFYEPSEKEEFRKLYPEYRRALRKYHFSRVQPGPESLYYHHGLRFSPDFLKKNLAGKLFADVGGWLGDSATVFFGYSPEKIIIFEPNEENRRILIRNLKKNSIPQELYKLEPFALSDQSGEFGGMECRKLDDLSSGYSSPFGVLKADIEGAGLHFLNGARETIFRDRPLLSLSIYHNEEEFAGIYRTLKSWNIDYHCEIKQFSPYTLHGEYSLFAYPAEWGA
ncbi:MAG: hypothetical protein IJU70_12455 [Lentisphaeria bacterium]|nr:hypothetical protein [Lentisphaeria bacterium]